MLWRLALIALAAAAALAPIPPDSVERYYSSGFYPTIQRTLTGFSNSTSFALFDLFWMCVIFLWVGALLLDLLREEFGWKRIIGRLVTRTEVLVVVVYLVFLASWGLNYRRPSLGSRLGFDAATATPEAAMSLAETAVERLNALYPYAHAERPPRPAVDVDLADAFDEALSRLGVSQPARPARPKHTLLDAYFRAAGVDGLTAPFFAETLIPSDLLEIERPVIVAHEWSHLAGFADEGEAGFVAWVTCLSGSNAIRYSGWLSLFGASVRVLPQADRSRLLRALGQGPVSDLRAMADRRSRNLNPTVSRVGWGAYDQYLRANRVESGTASYGEALQLALGTDVGRQAWREAGTVARTR